MKSFFSLPVLAAILSVSVAFGPNATRAELNVLAPDRGWQVVSRSYASMDRQYSRAGRITTFAQINNVRLGSSQQELVAALGQPVATYSDGSWAFNLSLDYPQNHRLICQYRVRFDEDDRVAETAWRRPQCSGLVMTRTR